MYDLISQLINHIWQTQNLNSTEQQTVYYISGAIIIILTVTFIDLFYRLIHTIIHRK